MTAKEKALELVENFEQYSDYQECDIFTQRERMRINAVKCALISVDEIIKELKETEFNYGVENLPFKYWQEVKQEIAKL
jgi:hypothetical protein